MKNTNIIPMKLNHSAWWVAKILLASLSLLIFGSAASYAVDADEESLVLEEVIVTARKRAENVQHIPIAISVLPKSIIEDGNFDRLEKFIELIPNTNFSTDSFTGTEISIRGSARNSSDEDPSVGVYRDGVYIGGLLLATDNFYDIEQVEVLRGPQAGLYGRNAVGGAINVSTVRPDFEYDGYVDVQVASKDRQEYRLAVNIPLVDDRWALRLSGMYINQDKGFNYVVNQDQYLDATDNKSARMRLLFTPNDQWEFLTTLDYFTVEGGSTAGAGIIAPEAEGGFADGSQLLPVPGGTEDSTLSMYRNFRQPQKLEQLHIFQEINYEMDWGTFAAIASYRTADFESLTDSDFTNYYLRDLDYDAGQDSTFVELRFVSNDIGRFRFTTGIDLIDEDIALNNKNLIGGLFGLNFETMYATGVVTPDIAEATGAPLGLPIEFLGLTPFATGWTGALGDSFPTKYINEQGLKSVAVYFEGNYELADRVELWGNLRYTRDKKSIDFAQEFNNCPQACPEIFGVFIGLNPTIMFSSSDKFTNLSPGIGINYTVNEDILTYAKVVTGFKSGGFNSISGDPDKIAFDSEETISFEVGAKTQWLDNRLRVNVAAFYQERSDALVLVVDEAMPINDIGVNAGEIQNKGLEVEISASPFEGFRLEIAAGYLDAEFTDFVTSGIDYSGNQVPNIFKYSLSAVASYHHPIADGKDLFSYVSYRNAWDGYTNHDNFREMDNPEIIDFRFGLKTDKWKFVGFVDNLTDNRYLYYESDETQNPNGGRHWGLYAPGRTYGIQAVYRFN